IESINQVNSQTCRQCFLDAFADPKEFTCILCGDFRLDRIKPLIIRKLGNIPSHITVNKMQAVNFAPFPQGIVKNFLSSEENNPCSSAVLSFPLDIKLDAQNIFMLDLICEIIEHRIHTQFSNQSICLRCLDVSYELPYYPYLDYPWLSIRYHPEKD